MSEIESVGIREFRDHLYKYTKENQEPIALTKKAKIIVLDANILICAVLGIRTLNDQTQS